MTRDLALITEQMLTAARKAGADAADALVVDGTSLSIEIREGALEKAERTEGIDIGLRVLVGQRQACVSASDTRVETIETIAQRAVAMAKLAPEDAYIGLADPSDLSSATDAQGLELFDPAQTPSPEELKERALEAEASAKAHSEISQVEASTAFSHRGVHLANSAGFSGGYKRSNHITSVMAIAGQGAEMERDFCGEGRIYLEDLPKATSIGELASERAASRMGARKPETGSFPIVFDERVSSSLIGHLMAAVNASAIARGASWLLDALGEQVLPTGLSVVENPLRVRGPSSRPFDAEGLACRQRSVVEAGQLNEWTLDLATARKLGMKSTASAARGVSNPPSPSVSNIALTQGSLSRSELLAEMGTGLLVTSMIGSSINPTTGDYSRGAGGFWVENGEICYPVNECTIAGNLREMLKTIVPANDALLHRGFVVPSLLVEGMTLAGK